MTEKEKAKAYDEAIERAKKLYSNGIVEEIFPELKESEDERIKKAIIEFFESEDDNTTYSLVRKKDIIAWLEKQGKEEYVLKSFKDEDVRKFMQYIEKQAKAYEFNLPNRSYDIYAFAKDLLVWLEKQDKNSIDKIEPKFKVGDWVVNKFGDSWHIDSLDKKNYQVSDGKGNYNYFPISKQDEMHLWTMQDAKDGNVICYKDEISLYKQDIKNYTKQETTFGGFVYYCCYDGKRFITDSFYTLTKQDETDIHPATQEQRDILMKAINDVGYEWDIKKKELKKCLIDYKYE